MFTVSWYSVPVFKSLNHEMSCSEKVLKAISSLTIQDSVINKYSIKTDANLSLVFAISNCTSTQFVVDYKLSIPDSCDTENFGSSSSVATLTIVLLSLIGVVIFLACVGTGFFVFWRYRNNRKLKGVQFFPRKKTRSDIVEDVDDDVGQHLEFTDLQVDGEIAKQTQQNTTTFKEDVPHQRHTAANSPNNNADVNNNTTKPLVVRSDLKQKSKINANNSMRLESPVLRQQEQSKVSKDQNLPQQRPHKYLVTDEAMEEDENDILTVKGGLMRLVHAQHTSGTNDDDLEDVEETTRLNSK